MTRYSLFCGRDPVALGIEDETGGWSIDALRSHIETCPICRCGTERLTEAMDMSLAAAVLGKSRSPKKTDAARKNARLGGWPKGRPRSTGLTALQQQAWDLRQQGLKIKEIAARMGRQPENVRQLLARAASKLNIPGGWAGIKNEEV